MVKNYKVTESSIATVERIRYIKHQKPNTAAVLNHSYRGSGLVRREMLTEEAADDVYTSPKKRISADNGRTWSEWEDDPKSHPSQSSYSMELFEIYRFFHKASGLIVRINFKGYLKETLLLLFRHTSKRQNGYSGIMHFIRPHAMMELPGVKCS